MNAIIFKNLKTYLCIEPVKVLKVNLRNCTTLQECAHPNIFVPQENGFSQKLLKVAVIGMPNAGKSTFINHLMDRKVCPTSAKVHTTRKKSTAIFTEGNSQIVFLDTPGLVTDRMEKKFKLGKSFLNDSATCLREADTIGVIHDVTDTYARERLDIKLIHLLEKHPNKQSFLVLNKIDVLKSKRKLLEITRLVTLNCLDGKPLGNKQIDPLNSSGNRGWPHFKEIFMVSALTGNGLDDVKNYLIKSAKPNNWMFPGDVWTDQPPEKIIVDTIKATLLDFLPQEIPYQMKPLMELYEVASDGSLNVVVVVKCSSRRIAKLAAGAANGRLRQITESAQASLQGVFHEHVKLQIVLQPPKED